MCSRDAIPGLPASRSRRLRRAALAFSIAGCSLAMLVGCVQGAVSPTSTPAMSSPATSAPASAATAAPSTSALPLAQADPIFVDGGTAEANKAYFDFVNNRLFAANAAAKGQAIIENLVAAGFSKSQMQLTPDRTVGNLQADSILFSVNIGGTCLLGQHGGGGYSSAVQKALQGGGCLIGTTRAIDF